ncbi:hypothetical protein F7725_018115 [Dissostichus mawsoni]|uniref:Uncharacterized protein n=1 Tax=Dissostichus mawsoni TaxID=36200 RepID=A0A7J5XTH7_DISMA|nr:hypothetical protein F7725_018115 [Dissostichus mawsoni]
MSTGELSVAINEDVQQVLQSGELRDELLHHFAEGLKDGVVVNTRQARDTVRWSLLRASTIDDKYQSPRSSEDHLVVEGGVEEVHLTREVPNLEVDEGAAGDVVLVDLVGTRSHWETFCGTPPDILMHKSTHISPRQSDGQVDMPKADEQDPRLAVGRRRAVLDVGLLFTITEIFGERVRNPVAVSQLFHLAPDSKREQFRRYLEKTGVVDSLTSASQFWGQSSADSEALQQEVIDLRQRCARLVEENKELKSRLNEPEDGASTEN